MTVRWAQPKLHREQTLLFCPSLDDMIPHDHPIRQLDAVLNNVDWSAWENRYDLRCGQPPIHPRLIAGAILYGLHCHLRSSRDLEDGTRNRIDFMWFLNNATIDHSTFAGFRKKFHVEIKGLNRQIVAAALELSMSKLAELAIDGTRIKAYSSRDKTRKADYLETLLDDLDADLDRALADAMRQDLDDRPEDGSPEELSKELKRLQAKRKKMKQALKTARERDAARAAKQGKDAEPVSVPVNDPDAHLQPNKEGGYAPNYTPTAAVDKTSGCIIAADVVEGNAEADAVLPAVEEAVTAFGQTPETVCTDSNLARGEDQALLEEEGVAFYAPGDSVPAELSPAARPDPREPLAKERWDDLPVSGKKRKQLTRGAFLYDAEEDSYWCPMGHALGVSKRRERRVDGRVIQQKIYTCKKCVGCPLSQRCLGGRSKKRSVTRDEYEEAREATARRMATEEGKALYVSRAPTVETVFGHIKGVLGIRQFWSVGLENVRSEWQWICASYNVKKLLGLLSSASAAAAV